jgi:hypothetical protein
MKAHLGVTLLAVCLTACQSTVGPQMLSSNLGNTQVTGATADLRFLLARPKTDANSARSGNAADAGGAATGYNVCAEPSPDVAKAISQAISENAEATLQGLKALGGAGSVNAKQSLSLQQNSAIAELGRRLATTQLLRDGVYRLCEAYANGAISTYEYALVLSRYGDTMVTLLAIEAVSGISDNQQAAKLSPPEIHQDSKGGAPDPAPKKQDDPAGANDANKDSNKDAVNKATSISIDPPARIAATSLADTEIKPTMRAVDYRVADGGFIRTAAPRTPKSQAAKPADAASGTATTKPPAAGSDDADLNSINSDAAKAVVLLQRRYLEQSRYAPFFVLCTALLGDRPLASDTAGQGTPPLKQICVESLPDVMSTMLGRPPRAAKTSGK